MKLLNFFVLSLLSLSAFAQDSLFRHKMDPFMFKEDRLILTLSSDNWSGLPDSFESKPIRSRGFSFLIMSDNMNKSGNIGFGFGLGFASQNVHTDAWIDTLDNKSALFKIPDSLDYKINKVSLNFITAALELRLRSNENKKGHRFKLNAGFLAGYLLQSHTKYDDANGKFKTYGIDHLNKFQYGITGRIGYNKIAASYYYSLVNVFEDGKGPELTPYSIGITFAF
jgi:hypothetical protein